MKKMLLVAVSALFLGACGGPEVEPYEPPVVDPPVIVTPNPSGNSRYALEVEPIPCGTEPFSSITSLKIVGCTRLTYSLNSVVAKWDASGIVEPGEIQTLLSTVALYVVDGRTDPETGAQYATTSITQDRIEVAGAGDLQTSIITYYELSRGEGFQLTPEQKDLLYTDLSLCPFFGTYAVERPECGNDSLPPEAPSEPTGS